MRVKKPINWKFVQDKRMGDWKRMKGDFGEHIVKEYLEAKGLSLERLQGRALGLPDFKVSGRPVMVEVKSHKARRPEVWQKHGFMALARMGWSIYIAHPLIYRDWSGEHIICTGIDWYIFTVKGTLERAEFPFRDRKA